jgi:hypothetical protein
MANPACEIKNGAAAYVSAVGGVDITPSATVVIRLASQAGVGPWSCTLATADELTDIAAINASLVIDSVAKTATFTAPVAGRALRFQSRVNQGLNNGVSDTSLTTTFCLYTRAGSGARVHALDETVEGNGLAGWGADINALLRTGGGGGSTLPVTIIAKVTKTAAYTIVPATDYLIVCATNTGFAITLPASPADNTRYEILNMAAGVNTVNGGLRNVGPATTFSLAQYQSITVTWDAASTTWLVT